MGPAARVAPRRRCSAAEGAEVVVTDVLHAEGEVLAKEIGATFLAHDVRSEEEWAEVVRQTLERHGRIDVLVNNAGIFQRAKLLDTDLETYRRITDVNQVGVFLGMKAVAPAMIEQGAGSIVNISSVAGLRAAAGGFAYGASKFAVTGMTKSAAIELARHGVRVNSIHPGIIETDMITEVTGGERRAPRPLRPRRAAAPWCRPVGGRPPRPVPRVRREQLLHRLGVRRRRRHDRT